MANGQSEGRQPSHQRHVVIHRPCEPISDVACHGLEQCYNTGTYGSHCVLPMRAVCRASGQRDNGITLKALLVF